MPTDSEAVAARRILRLALGTAMALAFSQAIAWPLSFIAPVLAIGLLGVPLPRFPFANAVKFALAMIVPLYLALGLLPVLLDYPLAGVLLLTLALFHCFFVASSGGAAMLSTMATMGITVTVAVGSVSIDAVLAVANGVAIGAVVGLGFVWLAHRLLPDLAPPPAQAPAKPEPPPRHVAVRSALRSVAIVLPVALWFLLSSASASYVAVMIKVASMGQEVSRSGTRAAGRSLLASTAAGGIAAVVGWQVLRIWPSLFVYVAFVAVAALVFGRHTFSGLGLTKHGATWSYGLLTMLIILAPAVTDSMSGAPAGAKFFDRLWMLAGATVYAVAAVFAFDAVWPARAGDDQKPNLNESTAPP
ncbi:MAG: DUF2955 domain-containing protein [Pseudomonadota bacterium]